MDMAAVECLTHEQLIRLIEHDVRSADMGANNTTTTSQEEEEEMESSAISTSSASTSYRGRDSHPQALNSRGSSTFPMSSSSTSASSSTSEVMDTNYYGSVSEGSSSRFAMRDSSNIYQLPGRSLNSSSNNLYSYYKSIADKSFFRIKETPGKEEEESSIQITAL